MHYAIRRIFAFALAIACLCFSLSVPVTAGSFSQTRFAQAQSRQLQEAPRRSFWDRLFHRSKPAEMRYIPPPAPRSRTAVPKIAPKNPDARRILVIGDSAAAALADALARDYANNPDIIIRGKAENNSGLSPTVSFDWQSHLSGAVAEAKPNLIIIVLGTNDSSAVSGSESEAGALSVSNPVAAYQERVSNFIQSLQKSGVAWLWIGLPSFKDSQLNSAATVLNGIYKQAVTQAGGHFVSIWEGFVNDDNEFILSGYDVNGRLARLRTNDGIGFTLAGKRKLAFYAEQAIDLLWGDNSGNAKVEATAGRLLGGSAAPINPLDIGAVFDAGGKPVLAGDVFAPHLFLPGGALAPAPAGRADNFTLPDAEQ